MADMNLAQDVGHLEGKLESLEKSVERLTNKVEVLVGVLDQGKGARWAALGLIGLAVAAVSALTSMLTVLGLRITVGH